MKKFNRIFSMDEGTSQKMKLILMQHYCVFNKVNLEEAEEERVHGNRVDSEAGGGDDVGAHHDQQYWDEAGKRNHSRDEDALANKEQAENVRRIT